jgi:hypothetical protein
LVSEVLDRIDEFEEAAFVIYCVGLLLGGLVTHAYDEVASLAILALVGFILAIPASLVLGAVLRLLAELFDKFT